MAPLALSHLRERVRRTGVEGPGFFHEGREPSLPVLHVGDSQQAFQRFQRDGVALEQIGIRTLHSPAP